MVFLIEKKYDLIEKCYGINLILQLLYEVPGFWKVQISQEYNRENSDSILPDNVIRCSPALQIRAWQ
jgi:hypothetical protein